MATRIKQTEFQAEAQVEPAAKPALRLVRPDVLMQSWSVRRPASPIAACIPMCWSRWSASAR